ncbi:MAG: hypothetical protein KME54_17320 [Tolypothrix brevis GSE-NOS-MK-07-07A]|nr:hypothetical protein [Tolypothrix brevis GSE-NOS-MK-07-07A]
MKIIHGTWIPSAEADFIQAGSLFLWVEIPVTQKTSNKNPKIHPGHLDKNALITFITQEFGIFITFVLFVNFAITSRVWGICDVGFLASTRISKYCDRQK